MQKHCATDCETNFRVNCNKNIATDKENMAFLRISSPVLYDWQHDALPRLLSALLPGKKARQAVARRRAAASQAQGGWYYYCDVFGNMNDS